MNDQEAIARAIELLDNLNYFNVATESDGQPWNSPVWAARDGDMNLYWSSWRKAVHSLNIARNPKVFLTLFDSTRERGTNNMRCLYLSCVASEVSDESQIVKAFSLIYPGETLDLRDFVGEGQKRFYVAVPHQAWLNCLSERELAPTTVKMRLEISIGHLRAAT